MNAIACVFTNHLVTTGSLGNMDNASAPPNSMVTIMIKNPNGSDQDFSLEVPLADTCVRDVKRLLHEKHPEHPEPSTQRLIFAGKLLVDESLTADVLKQVSSPHATHTSSCCPLTPLSSCAAQHDVSHPQTFHLMTPKKTAPPNLTAQRACSAPALNTRPAPTPPPPAPTPASAPGPVPPVAAAASGSATASAPSYQPANPFAPSAVPMMQQPMVQQPMMAYAAVQPGVPVLQMMDGQCFQLVVREWGGQPFVFTQPVMPAYAYAPFVPAGGMNYGSAVAAAAAPAVDAAAAAQAHGAGVGMGAGAGAAGGGGGDFFDDDGEEANTDSLKLLLKLALFVYILGQDGGTPRMLVLSGAAVAIFLAQTGRLVFLQTIGAAILARQRAPAVAGGAPATPAGEAGPRAAGEAPRGEGGHPVTEASPPGTTVRRLATPRTVPRVSACGACGAGGRVAQRCTAYPQEDAAPPDDGAGAAAAGNAAAPGLLRDLENVVVTFFTSLLPAWPAGEPAGQEVAAGGM